MKSIQRIQKLQNCLDVYEASAGESKYCWVPTIIKILTRKCKYCWLRISQDIKHKALREPKNPPKKFMNIWMKAVFILSFFSKTYET